MGRCGRLAARTSGQSRRTRRSPAPSTPSTWLAARRRSSCASRTSVRPPPLGLLTSAPPSKLYDCWPCHTQAIHRQCSEECCSFGLLCQPAEVDGKWLSVGSQCLSQMMLLLTWSWGVSGCRKLSGKLQGRHDVFILTLYGILRLYALIVCHVEGLLRASVSGSAACALVAGIPRRGGDCGTGVPGLAWGLRTWRARSGRRRSACASGGSSTASLTESPEQVPPPSLQLLRKARGPASCTAPLHRRGKGAQQAGGVQTRTSA